MGQIILLLALALSAKASVFVFWASIDSEKNAIKEEEIQILPAMSEELGQNRQNRLVCSLKAADSSFRSAEKIGANGLRLKSPEAGKGDKSAADKANESAVAKANKSAADRSSQVELKELLSRKDELFFCLGRELIHVQELGDIELGVNRTQKAKLGLVPLKFRAKREGLEILIFTKEQVNENSHSRR